MSLRGPRRVALDIARRSFRRLLTVLPRARRSRYGPQIASLFDELAAEALARRGLPGLLAVWLRSVLDLLVRAPREHLARWRHRTEESGASGAQGRSRVDGARTGGVNPAAAATTRGSKADAMDTLLQDIRYGMRSLARRPGFAVVVALTFALGIGANTAIFSVVNGVLLRELPYEQPARIVRLMGTRHGQVNVEGTLSWPNFVDVAERSEVFESAAAYDEWQPNLTGVGEPERLNAATVSTAFFAALGVRPALGRFFVPAEDIDGQDRVVVLSYGLWTRKFGADPTIVGRTIDLNDRAHTVIGVTPEGFEDPELSGPRWGEPALWRPLGFGAVPDSLLPSRGSSSYVAIARLKPGVRLTQARGRIAAVSAQLEAEYPDQNTAVGMTAVELRESLVGDVRMSLIVLLGVVGFVLAIAAANVGNLLLGRATERQQEMALRAALGATRMRLLRQAVTEASLLALAGGALGTMLAAACTGLLVDLGGPFIPRSGAVEVDPRVLAFAFGVSLLTGAVCGLAPVFLVSQKDPRPSLAAGARTTSGRLSRRFRGALVALEVSLTLLLLTGAGLLTRSLWKLTRVDPGIEPAHVLTFDLAPPFARYSEPDAVSALYDRLLEGLRRVPQVEVAALVNVAPLTGGFDGNSVAADDRPPPPPGEGHSAQTRSVTPGYFRAMGIVLLSGRRFEESDRADSPPVIIISEALARLFWPDEDPIGKRITLSGVGTSAEVVGVVADVKHLSLADPAPPRVYAPRAQGIIPWQLRDMTVVVRTASDPARLAPSVRSVVRELDPELPIARLRTMEQIIASSAAPPRFRTLLLGSFAALALILAALGIYSVVSCSVSQRLHEMAIRMAMGAKGSAVLRLMMGEGLLPVLGGLIAGLAGALALTRLLAAFLFEVEATDPLVFGLVPLVLLATAAAAILGPARRAARVDPMRLLRDE